MEPYFSSIGLFIHYATPGWGFTALTLVAAGLLYSKHLGREAFVVLGAYFLTTFTVTLLKLIYAVPRPEEALVTLSTYAFPSAHAATSTYFIVVGSWLSIRFLRGSIWQNVCMLLIIMLGLIVMYSRILIGVHTPFQVAIGALIGGIISFLLIVATKTFRSN